MLRLLKTNAPMHRVQTFLKRLGFLFSTRQDRSAKLASGGSKPILSHPSTMSFVMEKSKMVLLLLINCLCIILSKMHSNEAILFFL